MAFFPVLAIFISKHCRKPGTLASRPHDAYCISVDGKVSVHVSIYPQHVSNRPNAHLRAGALESAAYFNAVDFCHLTVCLYFRHVVPRGSPDIRFWLLSCLPAAALVALYFIFEALFGRLPLFSTYADVRHSLHLPQMWVAFAGASPSS